MSLNSIFNSSGFAWRSIPSCGYSDSPICECRDEALRLCGTILAARLVSNLSRVATSVCHQSWNEYRAWFKQATYRPHIEEGLRVLHQSGLFAKEYKMLLHQAPQHAFPLAQGLKVLHSAGLLSLENAKILMAHPQHAREVACGLDFLSQERLLIPENVKALTANAAHADTLGLALSELSKKPFQTDDHRMALIQNPAYAGKLQSAIAHLFQFGLLTRENLMALSAHPAHAVQLAWGFIQLHQARLLKDGYRAALIDNAASAQELTSALLRLHRGTILTDDHFNLLRQCPEDATKLAEGLLVLYSNGVLTPEHRNALIAKSADAPAFAQILVERSRKSLRRGELSTPDSLCIKSYLIGFQSNRVVEVRTPKQPECFEENVECKEKEAADRGLIRFQEVPDESSSRVCWKRPEVIIVRKSDNSYISWTSWGRLVVPLNIRKNLEEFRVLSTKIIEGPQVGDSRLSLIELVKIAQKALYIVSSNICSENYLSRNATLHQSLFTLLENKKQADNKLEKFREKMKGKSSLKKGKAALDRGIGNCGEMARAFLYVVNQAFPRLNMQMIKFKPGDHVFVLLNPKQEKAKYFCPGDDQEGAVVVCPWSGLIAPATGGNDDLPPDFLGCLSFQKGASAFSLPIVRQRTPDQSCFISEKFP